MKISVLGGSGFVGDYIISELLKNNHDVYALIRYANKDKIKEAFKTLSKRMV